MPTPASQPYPLQERTGPYSFLLGFTLGESEPYNAAILASDGSYYYMHFVGSRDQKNKLLVGQTCVGEPTFQAPAGAEIYDTLNQYKWISNGWSGGVPADGIDQPSEGMISASNFLGWTAFCPCITSLAPSSGSSGSGSGSGTGSGGGGGGRVVTPCCPGGVATTLFLTTSGSCEPALNGTFALTWNVFDEWASPAISTSAGNLFYMLRCVSGSFDLFIDRTPDPNFPEQFGTHAIYQAATVTCSPFDITGNATPVIWNLDSVCPTGPQTLTWSVTD